MTKDEFETQISLLDEDIKKIVNHHFFYHEDREDIYQYVMLNLVRSYPSFNVQEATPFSHWVHRVVSLRCKEKKREVVRRKNNLKMLSFDYEGFDYFKNGLEAKNLDPLDKRICLSERSGKLKQAWEHLEESDKIILKLYSYGFMDKEIIKFMDLKHCKERMRQKRDRAFKRLKTILSDKFGISSDDLY